MQFWSYGPFEVDLKQDRSHFWRQVREWEAFDGFEHNALCRSIGCYVFIMRYGERFKPFYVGKTWNRNGFYEEVFAPHKVKHYKAAIAAKPKHRPLMMLFPLVSKSERFCRPSTPNMALIEWMERTLIGMALAKNPDLYNRRDTKNLRKCIVDGVLGKRGKAARYDAADIARKVLTADEIE